MATCPCCSNSRKKKSVKCFQLYEENAYCHHCSFSSKRMGDLEMWFYYNELNPGLQIEINNN